ncbi:MAG: hypothetical protein AAGJ95_02825 [Cyanobacteria bacterium J06554_11]
MAYSLLKIAKSVYIRSRYWLAGIVNFLWRRAAAQSSQQNFQEIERTVAQTLQPVSLAASDSDADSQTGVCFSIADQDANRLVVVQEVAASGQSAGFEASLMAKIRLAIWDVHGLSVYAIALVEPNSLQAAQSGNQSDRIQRKRCKMKFMSGKLPVVADWSENPGLTSKVRTLLEEIELLAQQLVRRPTG